MTKLLLIVMTKKGKPSVVLDYGFGGNDSGVADVKLQDVRSVNRLLIAVIIQF